MGQGVPYITIQKANFLSLLWFCFVDVFVCLFFPERRLALFLYLFLWLQDNLCNLKPFSCIYYHFSPSLSLPDLKQNGKCLLYLLSFIIFILAMLEM